MDSYHLILTVNVLICRLNLPKFSLLKVAGPGGDGAKAGEGLFHNISRRISEY